MMSESSPKKKDRKDYERVTTKGHMHNQRFKKTWWKKEND